MELTTEHNNNKLKSITSTVQRRRLSPRQKSLLQSNPNNYCIDLATITTLNNQIIQQLFGNSNDIIVDIGFGNGEQLLELAKRNPNYNFIGIELYQKGIANLINQLNKEHLANIKIIYGDAAKVLSAVFSNNSIKQIQLFFPDPWPKLRHHKRRLINPEFLTIIKKKLCGNGILHIATDFENYAKQILKHIANFPEFTQLQQHNFWRPTTKFENRGIALGHKIWDMVFVLQ
jgi:tRNA (guanine-N7-)-methyltransferase